MDREYDVAIIGGSLAGASMATVLLREHPDLRVIVVERTPRFTRRVGEATVEVSAFFLGRVLGLTQHLNESHLVKQGMRFWFYNEETQSLADSSEIGGRFQVRLPSYQLDRAVLDEEVLRRACEAGAELLRPAAVDRVELRSGGIQTLHVRQDGEEKSISARWVIDASGVAALLARQEHWFIPNTAHPTAAAWARWRGVKDWDGLEFAKKFPEWSAASYGVRGTATNHIVGDGWWSWWIPLKGGDVSIGVVFDQRLVEWPVNGGRVGDRIKQFLMRHPAARELLADAQWVENDVHWRKNLAYRSSVFAGDGFGIIGDAAAFLDPLYSPGMDWIAYTVSATAELIAAQRRGERLQELIEQHNETFSRSYERWFNSIYRDKYEYIGEFDLMKLAFSLDLGFYYLGIVSQPFKYGTAALRLPPFATPASAPVYHLINAYNRRFANIARARRRREESGAMNSGRRFLFSSFTFSAGDSRKIVAALLRWGSLEIREALRGWRVRRHAGEAAAQPVKMPAQ